MRTLVNFLKDDKGLETVEWAVITALIVAGLIGVISTLGTSVSQKFTDLDNAVNGNAGTN